MTLGDLTSYRISEAEAVDRLSRPTTSSQRKVTVKKKKKKIKNVAKGGDLNGLYYKRKINAEYGRVKKKAYNNYNTKLPGRVSHDDLLLALLW